MVVLIELGNLVSYLANDSLSLNLFSYLRNCLTYPLDEMNFGRRPS